MKAVHQIIDIALNAFRDINFQSPNNAIVEIADKADRDINRALADAWPLRPDIPDNIPLLTFSNKEAIDRLMNITQERAEELAKRIHPLVRNDGLLHYIEMPDLFKTAFKWKPTFKGQVDANKVKLIGVIPTFHGCGYIGMFKPSVAEVLAQIPSFYVDSCNAFEVLFDQEATQNITDDFYGHRTTTLLYQIES